SIASSWLHSRTSASTPRTPSSMCSVIEPRSVRTPTLALPSPQRSWSGSAASCATVNGVSSRSPSATFSPSRTKPSRSGTAVSPSARHVPRLIQTARRCFSANAIAQPMWSLCSWVTKTASRSVGSRPARASRNSSSRSEKPASTSSRVVVMPPDPSTTVALPVLPLPRLQKRITLALSAGRDALAKVLEQQARDPLAVLGRLRAALRVEDGDGAQLTLRGHLDAVLREAGVVLLLAEAEHPLEQVRLLAAGVLGIDVADEVEPLDAVSVFDGEAGAVERDADATPGAVETIIELQRGRCRAGDEPRSRGATRCRWCRCDRRLRGLLGGAELDHQAREERRLELRIGRPLLPHRRVLLRCTDVDLGHPAVGDEDVAAGRGALDSRGELVEFAGRVRRVDELADRVADEVVRQLGAVLGPVGFDDAGLRTVLHEIEAVVLPERPHLRIDLLGRELGAQPAVVAEALDLEVADRLRRDDLDRRRCRGRSRRGRLCLERRRADRAVRRLLVARLLGELRQVGRDLEPGGACRRVRAIVDLVAGEEVLHRRAAGKRGEARGDGE